MPVRGQNEGVARQHTGIPADHAPVRARFNLFPLVLDSDGVPWAEATVFIVSLLENSATALNMGTYKVLAEDLAAFLRFIEDNEIDWLRFPKRRPERPTYRFRAYLLLLVTAGELARSTAKRRISTVIRFYRWLGQERAISFENPPWVGSERLIELPHAEYKRATKRILTTDLRISEPSQIDPYDEYISDGGKLRPLTRCEQEWIIDELIEYKNTAVLLIHLLGLLTGARIQTALTFRVRHFLTPLRSSSQMEIRVPIGPGTGIDTKNNKKMVLHIPIWLYEKLRVYAASPEATRRRQLTTAGDTPDQYLFLSRRGAPLYDSKEHRTPFNEQQRLRHSKDGQAIRQLISQFITPGIRARFDQNFSYRFHDLRASYGMNLTDAQLERVARGEITLHEAREFVKCRLGHESAATTDLYLQYRGRIKFIRSANDDYEMRLSKLVDAGWRGML